MVKAPVSIEMGSNFIEYFEPLGSWKAEDIIPVHIFCSKRTGIKICLAEIEGPIVNGYFCLATEAEDDDGLPHTLEHLIFLGSELYPYKGVLDLVANRCLASGTNAWTDTDHTCYTVVNAGAEGFLQLLPIYLDHILYPILSDAGFTTEVHHVNGEGEDAGVVYCEMQGCENTGEQLAHHAMLKEMYPEPSGYRYETGGIMKNLRESTTNEKVKNYHSAFYRPENLCIIVAGQVKINDLFAALLPFEERIISKPSKPPFTKPWQTPVPPLKGSVEKVIPYPCDDETNGLILVAWRGPHCKELRKYMAISQLAEYLTDSAISPLQREFVEQDDPFCTKVDFSMIENLETCFYFHFQNVPVNKLDSVKEKLLSILEAIKNGTEVLDMNRMKTLCRRKMLTVLSMLESNPHEVVAQHLIGDFLYGMGGKDLEERLNQSTMLKDFIEQSQTYWINLLEETFLKKDFIFIKGLPSKELMNNMAETEKSRIAKQCETLGESGLKQMEEILQKAIEKNEDPPPEEMISSIPVPSVANLHFHSIDHSSNHFADQTENNVHFSLSGLPVCFLLNDAKTNFVQLSVLLNTNELDYKSRLYLPLLAEVLLESPIIRNGELIPHEDVIFQLSEDTVKAVAMLGIGMSEHTPRFHCAHFAQVFQLVLKVELKRYTKAIVWLKELLFQTKFTPERLKIISNKMINSVTNYKRDGSSVAYSLMKDLCFGPNSNHHVNNMMRQHAFLSSLNTKLEHSPQEVINEMNAVREILTSAQNFTIHMSADVKRLAKICDPKQAWMNFLPSEHAFPSHEGCFTSIKPCHELLLDCKKSPLIGGIVGIGSNESAFLVQVVPCITSFTHEDLPAIMVLLQYLIQLEGPMWRQIRGLGLAYSYNIRINPEQGLLSLSLYKCSQLTSAYKEAKDILEAHITGKEKWDPALLDSAKSILLFEIIDHEKNITDVFFTSLLSNFRGVPSDYNRQLLQKVSNVTLEDVSRVGSKYMLPLINGDIARCSVCCHPSKVDEIVAGFNELSRELNVVSSLEDSFLSKF